MKNIILNFSDFILYEANTYKLYENEDESQVQNNSFLEKARIRLKEKVLYHITENESDASQIVNNSSILIESADKVLKNQDNPNWFMQNISYIAAGGFTALSVWGLMKGKKLKLARLEDELTKVKLGGFISNTKNLLASTTDDLNLGFGSFSKSLGQVEKRLKLQIEYLEKWKNYAAIDIFKNPLEYFQAKFSNISNTYNRALREIEDSLNVSKGDISIYGYNSKSSNLQALKSELELLNKELNWNFLMRDEIPYNFNKHRGVEVIEWKKIDNLEDRVKELFNKDKSSSAINGIYSGQKFFDEVKAGMKDFNEYLYPDLSKITKTLIDKIDEALLKLENQKLPDVSKDIYSFLVDTTRRYGLEEAVSRIEYKQIKSFLPKLYTSGGVVSGLGASLIMIIRLLKTDLFRDIPEVKRVLDIIENPKISKDEYVKRIRETIGSYDKSLGLNLNSIKFKNEKIKQDLASYISYYLADIIMEQLQESTAYMLYGKITQKISSQG